MKRIEISFKGKKLGAIEASNSTLLLQNLRDFIKNSSLTYPDLTYNFNAMDFLEENHPKYYSSNVIAAINDLYVELEDGKNVLTDINNLIRNEIVNIAFEI